MAETVSDWQSECKDIKSRVTKMYETASWSDCVFVFGYDKLLPAHRNVLSAASPVFATMFYGGMPETGGPIRVEDIQPDIFSDMLRYIYTDVINIHSYDEACALYYAAHKYTLPHLQKQCLEYLIAEVTPERCCLAYEFAEMFGEKDLSSTCENVMKTQTEEVLRSDGFLAASLNTVQFIYSMDKLHITTELELFKALEKYIAARKKCKDPCGKDDSANDLSINKKDGDDIPHREIKLETEKTSKHEDRPIEDGKPGQVTIRDIVKLIRFLTMTAKEFASAPAISPLLTQEEKLYLMINLNNCESNVPLPEGFSKMEEKRYGGTEKSRKTVKIIFTCPDCQYLEENHIIRFPAVYAVNKMWEIFIKLQMNDVCLIGTYYDKERNNNYHSNFLYNFLTQNKFRAIHMKLLFIKSNSSNSNLIINFEKDVDSLRNNHDGSEFVIGRFTGWIDVKNNCMKYGAITFEVTLTFLDEV